MHMVEADLLASLQDLKRYRELGSIDDLSKRVKEEDVLKFYYCESEDEYYVGQRLDTMYYASVSPHTFDMCFTMSRYLDWGKSNYPSEPVEISFSDWLKGYIEKYFINKKEVV